ncbi:uncharacterized protein ATNIH1004_005824 [Aspergillus tanneri]|uniref:Uncharacterized protein n=1 Tax=Aspergillus tanneri TaxID=1220188 RepID=A0A5M9MMK9_9EURO|nr:uncharacterized protein ATNIH1004_005824 [Aspergillus tanneri]KAA8647136.1 hypothetical protein ATNIH1004_005824 [Aspergillus tanneri]
MRQWIRLSHKATFSKLTHHRHSPASHVSTVASPAFHKKKKVHSICSRWQQPFTQNRETLFLLYLDDDNHTRASHDTLLQYTKLQTMDSILREHVATEWKETCPKCG